MIKLIPGKILSESAGERKVFDWFKKDAGCDDYIVIHSFFISKHLKRFSGEIDFLVLAPGKGIFLLEVKHGEIWRTDNDWFVRNREGAINKLSKSPFEQLHGTMFSFEKWIQQALKDERIKRRLGNKISLVQNLEFGYGVMLTSAQIFDMLDPGWEQWMIFTANDFRRPISEYINRLADGFANKYTRNKRKPDRTACETLLALIRGDFHIQYDMLNRINDTENLIDELNKEQFEALDLARYNDRCLFQGAAGTGKTILAVQLFIESVEKGRKTALMCYNQLLAQNLALNLKSFTANGSFVGTFESLLLRLSRTTVPKENQNQFFNEDLKYLCLEIAEKMQEEEKFDFVILDESQDLLNELNIEVLSHVVTKGIAGGSWSFFGDFNSQAIYLNNPKEGLRILDETAGFVKAPPLRYNCRNTKKIGNNASALTLAQQPLYRVGTPEGDEVEFYFPPTFNMKIKRLEEILEEFIVDRKLPAGKILILSPNAEELDRYHSDKIKSYIKNGVRHGTIHAYKGLESSVVIIVGFTSLTTDRDRQLLYIALTRPRCNLAVILDERLRAERERILSENAIKKLTV